MLNKFKRIFLISAFSLLIICPSTSFAWRYYGNYGDDYWNYHGSGRDYAYSEYIDARYTSGYADYSTFPPDYMDDASYVKYTTAPIIVTPPVQPITQVPAQPPPDEFTVNIPNAHGGYTAVVIKRSRNGYIGPQGEFYPEFPKISQLEIIYGK